MLKRDKFGKIEIFKELNSSDIWNENDSEFIYEPVKFIQSSRGDSFNPGFKSSHRILVPKFDSCDLSSILPKLENSENSKIILIADEGFGKTLTLKFIFLKYKEQIEFMHSEIEKSNSNQDNIFSDENVHFPIFIDFEKMFKGEDSSGRENLIEKIEKYLNVSPFLFTKYSNYSFIFIFDNIDKVPSDKIYDIIKDLKNFKFNFIISMNRKKFSHPGLLDKWLIYEILPFNRSQIINLIERLIIQHNKLSEDVDKIEISTSIRFTSFLPFILLPAETKNPHFVTLYTNQMIDYIKSKVNPDISYMRGKLFPDEIYRLLDKINDESVGECPKFVSIRGASKKTLQLIKQIEDERHINMHFLFKEPTDTFSDSFFFQKLFIKEFIENLLSNGESNAHEMLELFVDKIIEFIDNYTPFPHPSKYDYQAQICFEYLAIITRYLKNFYYEKYHTTQKNIFFKMKELYEDKQKHYLIRSNSLWLMRLSYDIEDKDLKKYGDRFPYSAKVPPASASLEDFNLFYSELLFIMKCCLNNKNIKVVTTHIREFSEFCPFSGLILYLYLTHQRDNFASEIEPLLTATDTEPQSLEPRFSSHYSLVVRAVETIGALGSVNDIDIFINHGFLDIYSSREFKEEDYSFIERASYYAIEELFYHKLEPNFDPLLVNPYLGTLKEPLQNKIPYLFDDINRHISIYASVCKNIDRTIRKTKRISDNLQETEECQSNLKAYDYYLLEKSGMILTEISKQYFNDKSYRSQRGKLIVSLYLLNDELRNIHKQAGMHLIEGDNKKTTLHFEKHTVEVMQDIVKSYTQEEPEDLIELSKVSFTNWLENYQLNDSDKPVFSNEIGNSSPKKISAHVVTSNLDILKCIKSKQPPIINPDKELVILDIGAGVGNTSEAVIEKYYDNKKIIYAVELLEDYVKLFCNRMGIVAASRYYLNRLDDKSIDYEVHIINEDVRKILTKFKLSKEGKLYFESGSNIHKDVITSIFPEYTNSAILKYLLENTSEDKVSLLKGLEKYNEKNEPYHKWLKWMENSLYTYSRLGDNKRKCCKVLKFRPFDLIIANYSLHHLTSEYRKDVYRILLELSSPGAYFAISDPNSGLSDKNRRYFNFTDEGVFACFMSRDECIREVEGICIREQEVDGVKGYKWVNIKPENIENEDRDTGYIAVFQKRVIGEISEIEANEVHYGYDVALSCASEDSEYVKGIADYLKDNDVMVYFYKYEEEKLKSLGRSLPDHFQNIFRDSSKHCIMFISKHYLNSKWTRYEKESALERDIADEGYIIPARFDNTKIPGLHNTKDYVDLNKESPKQLCKYILQKLNEK